MVTLSKGFPYQLACNLEFACRALPLSHRDFVFLAGLFQTADSLSSSFPSDRMPPLSFLR
uniref:Uncharacterized protein n=1 Tax=Picea sitchensis TaxID=3332 RepID=A0A6B9XPJ9_PICSI|nr:hypothetical protein Q903MT_gene3892 [Picea sitchensis]